MSESGLIPLEKLRKRKPVPCREEFTKIINEEEDTARHQTKLEHIQIMYMNRNWPSIVILGTNQALDRFKIILFTGEKHFKRLKPLARKHQTLPDLWVNAVFKYDENRDLHIQDQGDHYLFYDHKPICREKRSE